MEAYNDFSGGLNTVTSNDNLRDNEFPELNNVDLAERGSVKRRGGFVRHLTSPRPEGDSAQGYFRYYKEAGNYEDILAIEGYLYRNGVHLPIMGLEQFQTYRPIEAVQFRDKMYFATGTRLVTYDGVTARVIEPYSPQPLEALYIGTNALAPNPDQFVSDGLSNVLQINGITVNKRYGVANELIILNAYVSKPSTGTQVEYQWSGRSVGNEAWDIWYPFEVNKKQFQLALPVGNYEIRCLVRVQGTSDEFEYRIPSYQVKATNENKTVDTSNIQLCNRILVHANRIVLYGDPGQPDMIYFSDVDRPEYVPTLYNLRFENERREGLTALIEFRDMLVAFTPNSIHALFGQSPEDFRRVLLSSAIGCIAPYSAKVMENYIAFLSYEGIYMLKTLGYTEQRANVQKIDSKIDNIVPRETNACAIVAEGQYQIVFPTQKKRLRLYYQQGVWTKDESDALDFARMYEWGGHVYGQSLSTGHILRQSSTVWDDDGHIYLDCFRFKDFDFNEPYNPKKLKELQILLGQYSATKLSVYVYADGASIVNPDISNASVDANGNVIWNDWEQPNIEIVPSTILGQWILGKSSFSDIDSQVHKIRLSGKCRKVRLEVVHEEATANHILGVGFIFKLKSP